MENIFKTDSDLFRDAAGLSKKNEATANILMGYVIKHVEMSENEGLDSLKRISNLLNTKTTKELKEINVFLGAVESKFDKLSKFTHSTDNAENVTFSADAIRELTEKVIVSKESTNKNKITKK